MEAGSGPSRLQRFRAWLLLSILILNQTILIQKQHDFGVHVAQEHTVFDVLRMSLLVAKGVSISPSPVFVSKSSRSSSHDASASSTDYNSSEAEAIKLAYDAWVGLSMVFANVRT